MTATDDDPTRPAILVVDDDRLLRRMVVETLRDDGLAALGADGAVEALALLEASPDVVLLVTDIDMPGMSGLELLSAARAASSAIGLLIISGRPCPPPARLPEGTRFLAKPFTAGQIIARVRGVVGDPAGTPTTAER